jgi:hypothetical protein
MKARLATLGVIAMLVAGLSMTAATAAPAAPLPVTVPATCTAPGTTNPVGCTLSLVGFNTQGGVLNAVLQLTNTVTGAVTQIVVPLQNAGTCTILDLTIQPIDLELLGLHLHTDTIHIVLTAQRGTLLGDLLCGLFFGPNPLGLASTLLNSLLAQGAVSTA